MRDLAILDRDHDGGGNADATAARRSAEELTCMRPRQVRDFDDPIAVDDELLGLDLQVGSQTL